VRKIRGTEDLSGERVDQDLTPFIPTNRRSARKAFAPHFCHKQEQCERGSAHGSSLHMTCYKRPMRRHDYAPRPAHIKWLLDSDPAIRWQVRRDLTGEAPEAIAAERSRVAT